ncbi:MAG: hypothetical protein JRN21_04015 [Nitrososphaerota archaeon]|nr:hypothetical protein [Nitrososphaerota archaeon]
MSIQTNIPTQPTFQTTFISTTAINAGTTFFGNLTLPNTSLSSGGYYDQFYVVTEGDYNTWMQSQSISNGPEGGYHGTNRYIYNSITNTLTYPFHIKSNSTSTYYFVFTGSTGCTTSTQTYAQSQNCKLNLYESSLTWTEPAVTILGTLSLICLVIATVTAKKNE